MGETATRWYGWGRRRGRWTLLTGPHPSLKECSRALGEAGKRLGYSDKDLVMTGGALPPADRRVEHGR
jgi:hypothetical protein